MSSTLDRLLRDARTARHIPVAQLRERARFLVLRRRYAARPRRPLEAARRRAARVVAATRLPRLPVSIVLPEGLDVVRERAARAADRRFRHLGEEAAYAGAIPWVDLERSPLWQYQMQYLGCVLDAAVTGNEDSAAELLASWRGSHERAWDRVAWHPYPASLRLTNLCHAAAALGSFDALGPEVEDLVAVHAAYLLDHLERDVRGNHLLENARALLVASRFLRGDLADEARSVAESVLREEITEQVLADGGHFERAPMYHAIVLHRLLELAALLDRDDALRGGVLAPAARRMATFLARSLCPDGEILLFGDSARGFAPPARALLAVCDQVLDSETGEAAPALWCAPQTGVSVLRSARAWAALDTGPICPPYLPAHGQSDTLTVEIWIRGERVVADPGLCEYTGPERVWGRSSRAHSTVTLDDANHSEVYGSFRVGGRERSAPPALEDDAVTGEVRPWRSQAQIRRTLRLGGDDVVRIADRVTGAGAAAVRSRLHLAPGVRLLGLDGMTADLELPRGPVRVHAAHPLSRERGRCSVELGKVAATTILVQDLPVDAGEASGAWEIEPVGDE